MALWLDLAAVPATFFFCYLSLFFSVPQAHNSSYYHPVPFSTSILASGMRTVGWKGEERREKKVEEPPDTNTKNRFCSVFSRLGFFFWSRRGCKTPKSWNRLVGWQVEKEEKRGRKELTWSVGRVESDATCSWRTSPCRRARCRLWWRNGRSWPAAGWSPRCCRCKTTST